MVLMLLSLLLFAYIDRICFVVVVVDDDNDDVSVGVFCLFVCFCVRPTSLQASGWVTI